MIKKNNKYKILTKDGFKNFYGIQKINKSKYYKIYFKDVENPIIASINHPFIKDSKIIKAEDLKIGDYVDNIINNKKSYIVDIVLVNKNIELYDVLEVEGDNTFVIEHELISHNCSFLSSGSNVISSSVIDWYSETHVKQPIEKRYNDKLWIWEPVIVDDLDVRYFISCDVARGDGDDNSAMNVYKETISTGAIEQVAEYYGKIPTSTYAKYIVAIAIEYNNALVIIENNSIGWNTLQKVMELYDNVFWSPKTANVYKSISIEKVIETFKNMDLLVPGFSTNKTTRELLILNLEEKLRLKQLIFHSIRFINELNNFIYKANGKAEARSGYHDDLVMSSGIGLFIIYFLRKIKDMGFDIYNYMNENINGIDNIEGTEEDVLNDLFAITPKSYSTNPFNIDGILNQQDNDDWF